MTTPYHRILRNIALRAGALKGGNPAGLDVTFGTATLTAADFVGPGFEASKDALLLAEEKLSQAIADTGNHPWRRVLTSQTANISHGALIPSTDSSSKPVIGVRGSVRDSSDSVVCTEQPLETVRRHVRNANSWRVCPVYYYKIDDNRLYHTRTNVIFDVCTYDAATQRAAIDSNSNMLLPDVLEEALVCGGLAYLSTADEFTADYARYFDATLSAIRQGLASLPPKAVNVRQEAA